MAHPEELLAGYVDGDLPPKDRTAVDAHLAECSRCRGEVSLAATARSALRSLPEVPGPAGLATRALREARGAGTSVSGGTPRWYRVAGIAAAAAAGLLVLTLTLPHIGQSSNSGGETPKIESGGDSRQVAQSLPAQGIEIQHANYDSESLASLSRSYAGDFSASGGALAASGPSESGSQKQTDDALACIQSSAPDATGTLTRLIRARFEGTPAFLAVFLEGPGAGQPADAVNIWILATRDCAILSYSHAKL